MKKKKKKEKRLPGQELYMLPKSLYYYKGKRWRTIYQKVCSIRGTDSIDKGSDVLVSIKQLIEDEEDVALGKYSEPGNGLCEIPTSGLLLTAAGANIRSASRMPTINCHSSYEIIEATEG